MILSLSKKISFIRSRMLGQGLCFHPTDLLFSTSLSVYFSQRACDLPPHFYYRLYACSQPGVGPGEPAGRGGSIALQRTLQCVVQLAVQRAIQPAAQPAARPAAAPVPLSRQLCEQGCFLRRAASRLAGTVCVCVSGSFVMGPDAPPTRPDTTLFPGGAALARQPFPLAGSEADISKGVSFLRCMRTFCYDSSKSEKAKGRH